MSVTDDGFWDQVKGNWKQVKGKVREKWGLLTDDDLEHIAGHKDHFSAKIRVRRSQVEPGPGRCAGCKAARRRVGL